MARCGQGKVRHPVATAPGSVILVILASHQTVCAKLGLRTANYATRYSGHYLLAVLIAADECGREVCQLLHFLQ